MHGSQADVTGGGFGLAGLAEREMSENRDVEMDADGLGRLTMGGATR